jgi:beta-glucosidase-like glycosyl hydrolase
VQEDHREVVRAIGAASTILLKNVNETLPLKKPRNIAIIGSDAGPQRNGPNEFTDRGGVDGVLAMGWGVSQLTTLCNDHALRFAL